MKPNIGIGFRIGKLTVSEPTGERKNGYMVWNCTCDCGGAVQLDTRTLQRGTVRDCGCETKVKPGQKDLRVRDLDAWYVWSQVPSGTSRVEHNGCVNATAGSNVLPPPTNSCAAIRKVAVA